MRSNHFFFCLIGIFSFLSTVTFAQTTNFDETWKEFLENNKISNMSELVKPDKVYDQPDYAKYLLMNTNTNFCQSDIEEAAGLLAEVQELDANVLESIEGFVVKMKDIEAKMKAFHSMDAIWQQFLETREVSQEELEAVTAAKTSCEKSTLAKYSYMTAYHHFCQGEISISRDIFENRTLKLAEKTSLRVEDVEGLAAEVAKMKALYRDLSKLDIAWNSYIETGVSPGFEIDLPLFPCYPIPNMKAFVLKGVVDMCSAAPEMLDKIKKLQADSGVIPDGELAAKVKELESGIEENAATLAVLNEAWEAFLPENQVDYFGTYGYEYCSKEPLIRAYIMDGFAYVCGMAEEMLGKIDDLQKPKITPLEEITMLKINELAALNEQYQANGLKIEKLWNKFVAQGDTLFEAYPSTEVYCDNIQQVKDWTINGLCGSCEDAIQYLEKIEAFQENFNFNFQKELECRVQNLRIKIWECRHQALLELARIEAPDAPTARLEELMAEYGMAARPTDCLSNE